MTETSTTAELAEQATWFFNAPVPHWLGWIVVVIAILGIPSILHWFWRNWGANLWARRSRQAALWRARKTAKQLIELGRLRSEPGAFTAVATWAIGQMIAATVFFVTFLGVVIVLSIMKQEGLDTEFEDIPRSIRILYIITFSLGFVAAYVYLINSWVTLFFTVRPLRRWERHCEIAILRTRRVLLSAGMTNEDGKQWFKALLKDPDTPPPSSFLSKDRS